MKPFVRNIMFTGVIAMAASSIAVAQTSSSWFEQKYRAETVRQVAEPANTWNEGWYRAKFGRPSPLEEMRLKDRTLRSLRLPLPQVKLIAAGGVNQQTATGSILAGTSATGTQTLTSPSMAIAQQLAVWQAASYSHAEVKQMLQNAHTPEQYQALAAYFREQQQSFRERARGEWSEAVRRSQFSFVTAAKYPRPVDSSMNRYEYFSYKSRQMAQKAAYFERLSARASQ